MNKNLKIPESIRFIKTITLLTAILTFTIASFFLMLFLIQDKPVFIDDERIETTGLNLLFYGTIFLLMAFLVNLLILVICFIAAFQYRPYQIMIFKCAIIILLNVPISIIYIKIINHYYLNQ